MIKATKPVMPLFEAYVEEIRSIWDEGAMTNNGPKVIKFQKLLKEYIGSNNADLFVNGHSALMIAIKVLGLSGEVITSPFTFASTTNAIVQSGLTPVFCDIDDTYNIDVTKIERNITDKTSAIIVPHIFGIPCNVQKIQEIADAYKLKVLYDGAQAFGTKVNGKNIGCFGDVTMFSLHAIKLFNSIEGGLLTYNDEFLSEKFSLYRNFGISYGEKTDVLVTGWNAKMNEFQAAMGLVNLKDVEQEIEKRYKLALIYKENFADIHGIHTYNYDDNISYNYAYFPVKINRKEYGMSRDEVWDYLKRQGVQTRKLYDTLTCDYTCYRNQGYKKDIEYARRVTEETLDFPIYGTLEAEEIEYIASLLRDLGK